MENSTGTIEVANAFAEQYSPLCNRPQDQKVVVHTKAGELAYGVCTAFNPNAPVFHLSMHDKQGDDLNRTEPFAFDSVKAVFYVKSYDGQFDPKCHSAMPLPPMEPMVIEFLDGEVLAGRPVQLHWEEDAHFYFMPEQRESNNILVLVERSAVKAIYDYEQYRMHRQSAYNAFARTHFKPGMSQDECLGDFFFSEHDYKNALHHYIMARERETSNDRIKKKLCAAKYNLGARHIQHKDYVSALAFMEQVLAMDPEHEEARRKAEQLRERLRMKEAVHDVHSQLPESFDKQRFQKFLDCDWVRSRHTYILTGPPAAGKTRLACSLGHKACREGLTVAYHRMAALVRTLSSSREDSRFPGMMTALVETDLLILDDWAGSILADEQWRDVLEIIEERHQRRATLFVAELPVEKWHQVLGADASRRAILGKLLNEAHKISIAA